MNNNRNKIDTSDPLVKKRYCLNPYILGGYTMVDRFLWDLYPQSWISRYRLKKMRDLYKNKKAIILCNGPSLLKVDFSLLDNVFTFGLNKINLLFDKKNFRPSCIVAVNKFVIEQNSEFYNSTNIPLFLECYGKKKRLINNSDNIIFIHSFISHGFAKDCSMSIQQGNTVTYVAMQLAFHMGFEQVALVGADHNFSESGPANKAVVSGKEDKNHFDPNYFSGGVKWHLPDLFESEMSYIRAKKVYEAYNRKIYNCTKGGKLDVFPRRSLVEFIDA